ncbi:FAD-binding oxidoreductase [Streptomyces boluensis]|uniref:FAD-binding protein n=1 Tax=Streptomyces boluensis TaxID=1775135 RepID=A0A964UJ50_9ACTN|nr:FAD-binding oxidoreductase [Streptomyces boluensis]NBE49961.1 FAD-binding protein [Streptomyces boluensis]
MNTAAATTLAEDLTGEVILPGGRDYDALSKLIVHKGAPAVIVRCHSTEDVRKAVRFAREQDLLVSVRSGGHSNAGLSTNDGGIVIDLSPMNGIEVVDADDKLVRVGPGAQWSEVATVLDGHGLGFSSGDTTSVGVGGLLLGGGIGWMVRKGGLSLDNVRSVELVTADGDVVRASTDDNPELFWALRGGSGNFGIATSFEITAHAVDGVTFGTITYPAAEAASVVKGWARYLRTAPDELTSHVALFPTFGGDPNPVTIQVCHCGDEASAEAAIAPLLALGSLQSKDISRIPYPETLVDAGPLPEDWQPTVRNRFVPDVSDGFVDALVTGAASFDTLFFELRSLGGAVGRVPADATAFAHRDAAVMLNAVNLGTRAYNLDAAPGLDAFWKSLAPYTKGAYSGFLSELDEGDMAAVYPPGTRARLQAVKDEYDPQNLFSRNPNVEPSTRG